MGTYDLTTLNVEKLFDKYGLSDKKIAHNVDMAIKNTSNWARNEIAKEISYTTKLPQKVVKSRAFSNKSKRYTHSSYVVLYRKPMNLVRFGAKKTKQGLTSRVMSVPGAFLAKMPHGKTEIAMKRRTNKRLPIDPVTYDIKSFFDSAYQKVVSGDGISKRFEYELNRRLQAIQFKRSKA